jgi:lipoyl(octanoyl) transferase
LTNTAEIPQDLHGAKIAALGLKVTKQCSYHGLALNVDMDLAPFSSINPCGYAGLKTIDMKSLGVSDNIDIVAKNIVSHLSQQLEVRS